ncbi:hypothetical protein LUZ60_010035 [Juncus effusus]|nr:hypothetical protein LUZ60_010035 [Juncus effusus]
MDWPTRMKIALGVAKGLAYLHEDCHPTVHGDIKASNIILDHNFNAKVTDFGFTKFVIDNIDYARIIEVAPLGYIAPEYMSLGKLTFKSDVYSFGVILLELITGKQHVDARAFIKQFLETRSLKHLVDPRLENNFNAKAMKRMIQVAAACLRDNACGRPHMSEVVTALEYMHHCVWVK